MATSISLAHSQGVLISTCNPSGRRWVGRVYLGPRGRLVLIARGSERYVRLATDSFCAVWRATEVQS